MATIRAPVAAKGWPVAREDPATLRRVRSTGARPCPSQDARVAGTWEANASWISYRSKSSMPSPARSSRRGTAYAGAMTGRGESMGAGPSP